MARQRLLLLGFSLALFPLLSPSRPALATDVSGTLASDTTWTVEGSPYIVDHSVTVGGGVTRTIDPGVVVKFGPDAQSYMRVYGTLVAEGTSEEPILFTSLDDIEGGTPAAGDWAGIFVNAGGTVRLSHCEFQYGGYWYRTTRSSAGILRFGRTPGPAEGGRGDGHPERGAGRAVVYPGHLGIRWPADPSSLDMLQITLDGPRDVHDRRRRFADGNGSYDPIMKALDRAARLLPRKVVLRVNLTESTADELSALLEEVRNRGLKELLGAIDLAAEYSPQTEIEVRGCESRITRSVSSKVTALLVRAAEDGWPINKSFVQGPCTFVQSNSFAIDEGLRVYKCPGFLYQEADEFVDDDAQLKITNSRWYSSVTMEPDCVAGCAYAPICYGGCRWMSGGVSKVKCNKGNLNADLTSLIRAYIISRYTERSLTQIGAVQ